MTTLSNFLSAAQSIIKLGFRVVPHGNAEPHRHPLVKDWPNVATRDREQIKVWARDFLFHKPSVGIVAGDESIWALDVDEVEYLDHKPPKTASVRSGGGGLHLYFKHDRYSRSKLLPLGNVFVRGTKRDKAIELFVKPHALLAPGTVHHKTGKVYEWIREMKPAVAPRKFVDAIAALPWNRSTPTGTKSKESGYWSPDALADCLTAFEVEHDAGRRDGQFRVPCPWNASHGKPSDSLSDKTTVFIRDGWPCFSCFSSACQTPKKTWRDFVTFHDPLRRRFSIDSWLSEEAARIRKEFRRER
jgi:hypothetical protein